MGFDLNKLNKNQKEAVLTTDGPLLIIAGPGTGKTHTLISRTIYLISKKNVKPENIMIVTFTEKAAEELVTRLSNSLLELGINLNLNEMYIGTFHSICLRLLKEYNLASGLGKNFRLMDEFDQQYFVYSHFWNFRKLPGFDIVMDNKKSIWDKSSDLMKYINLISEELINPDDLISSDNYKVKFMGELIKSYSEYCKEENLIDFSSVQTIAYRMLKNNSEIINEIQNKISYFMVDEYQDTNYVQEQIALLLSSKNNNLCVVGDDDQGLYRFRGATIRNIFEFPYHFNQECKVIKLDENYRSEKDIVNFYHDWMESTSGDKFTFDWDKYRYYKKLKASKSNLLEVNTVVKLESSDEIGFNETVEIFIKKLLASGKVENLNQIAFLFRSVKNAAVKGLADYLENNGINVYSPRSDMFFDRKEILQLIGCLILMFPKVISAINKEIQDDTYRKEICNYYYRCLTEAKELLCDNSHNDLKVFIQTKAKDHLYLKGSVDYSFSGLIYQMLQFEPFYSYVDVDVESGVLDTRSSRNIAIFIGTIIKFEFLKTISVLSSKIIDKAVDKLFFEYLKFLFDGGIAEYEDNSDYAPSGCISFLTIHQSKGLEFPIVVVGNLGVPREQSDEILNYIEDNFAHRPSFEPRDYIKYFDFWRLYYTAFSRAQNLLVLLANKTSKKEPSKYFAEQYDALQPLGDLDKFEFEKMKKSNVKETYAFTSDIQVYESCPTQYKFYRELGFQAVRVGNTIFGTLIHQTIEDIHKCAIEGNTHLITEEKVKEFLNVNYNTISKKENSFLAPVILEAAQRQVMNYVNRHDGKWNTIKETEIPITYVKEEYILKGQVDLIQSNDGKYEIIDFKSGLKPNLIVDNEIIEKYRKQLEIYSYLVEKKFDITVDRMSLYYTSEENGSPLISFDKEQGSINKTISEFDSVVKDIESKKFKRRCNDKSICKNCDFRYYCRNN